MFKNTKKYVVAGLAVTSVVALLAGCGGDTKKAEAPKEKVLKVGTNATFVPFEFKGDKSGTYEGYDIDMINAIAKKMNAKIEFKDVAFDALIPGLQSKDIDIAVSGMTITKARAEKVLFSAPYYESGLAIVTKGNDNTIKSIQDLAGKNVAVQMGTTGADLAKKIDGAAVKQFDHSSDALMELKIGGASAVILDLPVAQYYASKHPEEKIQVIAHKSTEKEYFGMAIAKDNKQLQEDVNKAIAELKASGEFNKIYQKWFKQDASADMPAK